MAMAEVGTWIIDTGLEAVGPVAEAVRALALPVLGEEGAGDLELALTEAVTNVIRHGYGPEGGPVRVEAEVQGRQMRICIFDWGRQVPGEALAGAGLHRFDFDPEDIEGLPAGGMGLSLITVLMDEVSYRTDLGQNRLTLLRGPRD
jgi:serine/threonine-protein kinase RsbW